MAITVRKNATDAGAFDVLSGKFRIGAIKPINTSGLGEPLWAWMISSVLMGGDLSGTGTSVEKAAAALLQRWRRWLEEADLMESGSSTTGGDKKQAVMFAGQPLSRGIVEFPTRSAAPSDRSAANDAPPAPSKPSGQT